MRTFLRFLFFLLAGAVLQTSAIGQTLTTVTGTITDSNGLPYGGARIVFTLVSPGGPSPSLTPCSSPVGCQIQNPGPVTLNASGSFTINLWANASILPAGTTYSYAVTEPGVSPPFGTGPQVLTVTGLTISGATQTITGTGPALTNITGVVTGLNVKTSVTPPAIGDARKASSITWSGSGVFTISSATAIWQQSDVGKFIFCNDSGAGTNGVAVGTKISSINAAGTVAGLSAATINTTIGSQCVWYTQDDTASFVAAQNIVLNGAPPGSLISPGQWLPSLLGSPSWVHSVVYAPCGGYVVSAPWWVFATGANYQGIGLRGESKGCTTFFLTPTFSFGTSAGGIEAIGPVNNIYVGDFTIDGVYFTNAAYNNHDIVHLSMFGSQLRNVGGYNISCTGACNGAVINVASSSTSIVSGLFIQNNGFGACEISFSGSILFESSICSNSGNAGNVENLLIASSNNENMLNGKIEMVGDLIDECGTGPCSAVTGSTGVDFSGSTLWSSHDETAISVDGTSSVQFENSQVGAYNNQNNATALNIASGGVVRASSSYFTGTGTGFCYNNSGTFIDVGGNRCTTFTGGGVHTGTGSFVSTLTHAVSNAFQSGTLAVGTVLVWTTDQPIAITNIGMTAGNTPTCSVAPTIRISDGTVTMNTSTNFTGSAFNQAFTTANIFPTGDTITLSVNAAGTCGTAPTNDNFNIRWASYLSNQ